MRSWIAPLALLAACGFRAPTVPTDGGDGGVDTPPDTPVIPPDAQQCFGPFLNVCLSALPTTAITVQVTDPDLDINTDMGATASPLCDPGSTSYCIVAATAITINSTRKLRAHGARPLVLVAVGPFELFGEIDVTSSQDGTVRGAGASTTVCSSTTPPTQATAASGGFGGSFGGRGGDGEQVGGTRGIAAPT